MAGTDATDLHLLCGDLLDASIAALDTIPDFAPGLGAAPERSFISPGPPALDCCDQLTVHVVSVTEAGTSPLGLASGRRNVSGRVNHVGLVVTITRCIPTGDDTRAPETAGLEAAAEQTNADAWALWNHLWNMWRADALFTMCGEVFWDGLRPVNPSGGCAGWTLNLRVSLEGYEEVIES